MSQEYRRPVSVGSSGTRR